MWKDCENGKNRELDVKVHLLAMSETADHLNIKWAGQQSVTCYHGWESPQGLKGTLQVPKESWEEDK